MNKKYLFIGILFCIVALFSWKLYFFQALQHDTVNINEFPKVIDGWTSEELSITEDEYAILETKNAFVRRYTSPQGKEVYLYIVYSQYNRKVAHPPEVCYSGSGISIVNNVREFLPVQGFAEPIGANRLLLEKGTFQQYSYYWFKVGDIFTPNYWKQQFIIAKNSLAGKSKGSALIRISVDIPEGDLAAAVSAVKEFTNLAVPIIQKFLP